MTLTPEPARPSNDALLVILIEELRQNGLEVALRGEIVDWMDAAYQDHQDALDGLLNSRPLTEPVERQDL